MAKEIIKVEKLLARAKFDAPSFNKEARTVDVILATETTDVMRYDWRNDTYFFEQLVISSDTVRMDRINASAPFLDNHNSYGSVSGALGVVVPGSAKLDGNVIRCTVKFSAREEAAKVMQDVQDGILRNISVGYKIFKYERQPIVDGETPIYRAIDWEPYECSLVLIPADIGAGVGRSLENRGRETEASELEVDIIDAAGITTGQRSNNPLNKNQNSQNTMKLEERALAVGLPATATLAEVEAAERKAELTRRALAVGLTKDATVSEIETAERKITEGDSEKMRKAAADAERARVVEINALVRKMKLSAEFGDKLIADGVTIDSARALAIDELSKTDPNFRNNVTITGKDETDKKRDAISAALVIRSGALDSKEITAEEREISQEYRYMSLLDLAKMSLEAANPGSTRGLDKMEIAKRAITSHSSDFPVYLEGTNRRVLMAAYKNTPDKWRQFCVIGTVGDFREYKRIRPGSLTRLDALLENAEFKNKKITDGSAEKISAGTFGNIINVSRQMIVNDDLQAFTSLTKALGRAAARGIEIDVFALLASNGGLGPVMSDGKTLFHADHKNIAAVAAAPSMTSFDAMATLLASQTDREGNDYLDLNAAIWLGPKSIEGLAKSINGSEYDPDAATKLQKPNIVKGMFTNVLGTPRMAGTRWYAFANPAEQPVIEVAFLDGQEAPFMESQETFSIDGIQWKVRLDYGIAGVDYVGAGTNAGA